MKKEFDIIFSWSRRNFLTLTWCFAVLWTGEWERPLVGNGALRQLVWFTFEPSLGGFLALALLDLLRASTFMMLMLSTQITINSKRATHGITLDINMNHGKNCKFTRTQLNMWKLFLRLRVTGILQKFGQPETRVNNCYHSIDKCYQSNHPLGF